jgi:hypothetical protein
MILDSTTRTLEIVLGEAKATTNCDIVACYAISNATTMFVTAVSQTVSNGTTPVTVVSAPDTFSQTQVNEVRLHNNDTVPHTVTLRLNDAGVTRVVLAQAVAAGGDFLYTPTATSVIASVGKLALTLGWGGGMAVTPGTYVFVGTAAYPFVVTSLDASVGSAGGTITANVRNAGNSVGGLGAAAITLAGKTNYPASAANALVMAGATIDVVLALTGSPAGAFLSLNGTKLQGA